MCSTTAMGTGRSAGKRGTIVLSACGPPVEMPMTTMSTLPAPVRARTGARTAAAAGGAAPAPAKTRRIGASAASFTLSRSPSQGVGRGAGADAAGHGLHLVEELVADLEQAVAGQRGRLLHEIDGPGVERRQHLLP